jgi:hypothetical protein
MRTDTAGERSDAMSLLQLLVEAQKTLHASMGDALPSDFWQHVRSSRREGLLAMRSLIDAQISRLEQQEQQAHERTATKITVE